MKKEIDTILAEKFPNYDINADDETKDDFWHELSEKEKYDINAEHLRRTGDPKYDYLLCWEPGRFDTGVKATDYNDMFEIDYEWWEFQKKCRWEYIEDHKKSIEKHPDRVTPEKVQKYIDDFNEEYGFGYRMNMGGDWYRLFDGDTFLYSQFISAKWFLFYEAEDLLDSLQEKHIPYTFKDDFFERLSSNKSRDPEYIYDADGREKELDSFNKMIQEYKSKELIRKLDFYISKFSKRFSGCTFRQDKGYEEESFDPFTDFIFFDELSLKLVSPKNFLNTFNSVKVDYKEFQVMIDELLEEVKVGFYQIYNENRSRFI